jgi:hypothetical protein
MHASQAQSWSEPDMGLVQNETIVAVCQGQHEPSRSFANHRYVAGLRTSKHLSCLVGVLGDRELSSSKKQRTSSTPVSVLVVKNSRRLQARGLRTAI